MLVIPPELANEKDAVVATRLGVSRQAVLYARRRAAGVCLRCGRKAAEGTQHCNKHRRSINAAQRANRAASERKEYNKWQPGGKGRPPVEGQA